MGFFHDCHLFNIIFKSKETPPFLCCEGCFNKTLLFPAADIIVSCNLKVDSGLLLLLLVVLKVAMHVACCNAGPNLNTSHCRLLQYKIPDINSFVLEYFFPLFYFRYFYFDAAKNSTCMLYIYILI